jgi:uncharacterized protein YjbJ (UPF0337 family)
MNEDVLKGKWNEIKGRVKEKWGKLTDDDLTAVEGKKRETLGAFAAEIRICQGQSRAGIQGFHRPPQGEVAGFNLRQDGEIA